ncbi:sodium:solute symporter family protein [Methanolobus halotolerans]|uniref:Sodium:proline symporter n=1 Tax=Methanolobus halotolerans TaxID=2052935 RepID=A0A4E0PSS3_9EURY|nr:sodium:solute symporter family protein [Methanolobus halotolerans]TGC07242.1 sodium:proline symporter [Methanolobus halotolerans]
MENYMIFIILMAVYLLGLISIGLYFSKKQKSVTDFWLAGRKVGPLAIGFSAASSWMTAGGILAVIGLYMLLGMGSVWEFVAPNILALLIIALLVGKIKHLPAITQPELLEQRYSSSIRAPVAIIIAIVMILFAVADIIGFSLVLSIFFGLEPIYAAAIVAIAISLYVTLGGFSAVIWTDMVQFLLLATFSIVTALLVVSAATAGTADSPAISTSELFGSVSSDWWDIFNFGLPAGDPAIFGIFAAIVFLIAIIPGWITEQDPWQRIWAAKDRKSARTGMILGSFFIFLIFGVVCTVIAIGLNHLYPEISASMETIGMGAMAQAEPALLVFIAQALTPLGIGLAGVGLAAAAMSSADTFATSGGSCLSRDIYQRFIKPDATMKEMMVVNRISVLIIILVATVLSFYIQGIIEAIHIATFIASASYFFPLMGGLYWKRATKQGALAGLIVGAIAQISFTVIDYSSTPLLAIGSLSAISPLLANHGVIIGMVLSGTAFFGVSLLTQTSDTVHLAPFFADEAEKLAKEEFVVDESDPQYRKLIGSLDREVIGDRAIFKMNLEASATVNWDKFVNELKNIHPSWVTPTGINSVYRLTKGDMLACVSLSRGNTEKDIWFASEPMAQDVETHVKEFFSAFKQVSQALENIGILLTLPTTEEV